MNRPAATIHVEAFGRTDAGRKRADNQDSMLIADLDRADVDGGYRLDGGAAAGSVPGAFALGARGAVFLVADGMGGAAAGGMASHMAVTEVQRVMLDQDGSAGENNAHGFALRLRAALEAANARIHELSLQDRNYYGMGTTATLGGLFENSVYFAQVGDSRGYLVRNGAIVQLTRDQSMVQQLVDAGSMTEDEAERSEHSNKILQALGPAGTIRAIVTHHAVRRGDVILLCSDGLTRVVRKDEIAEVVSAATDLAGLCQTLVDLANERGGPDNVTVVAVRLDGDGLPEPVAADALERMVYDLPIPS